MLQRSQQAKRPHTLKTLLILALAAHSIACDEATDSPTAAEELAGGSEVNPDTTPEVDPRASSQTRTEASVGESDQTFEVVSSSLTHQEDPEVDELTLERHIEGNQALTFDLHRGASENKEGNIVTSAWSLRQAFALLYPGAKNETKRLIGEAMQFDEDVEAALSATNLLSDELSARQLEADEDRGRAPVSIKTANSIWAEKTLTIFDDFLDLNRVHLDASVYALDFKNEPERSRDVINGWVSHETEDRVNDLLPEDSVTPDTLLVLTNAVHFQAPWSLPFKEHQTSDQPFETLAGETLEVPTLTQTASFSIAELDELQALTLPFRGNELAMTFVMPTEGDLAQLEGDLTPELWSSIRDAQEPAQRQIFLPKFKFEFNIQLNEVLEGWGLGQLFTGPDLSGISDRAMRVSRVLQKAFIEVAEEGAEAAAATAILIETGSAPGEVEPPQQLRFDQPFLFFIHDLKTGAVLFMGRVVDPR